MSQKEKAFLSASLGYEWTGAHRGHGVGVLAHNRHFILISLLCLVSHHVHLSYSTASRSGIVVALGRELLDT